MSHIARVGRKSWKVRAGIAALYGVLAVGAVTTLYPFLLMVSTAMKSQVDYAEYSPQGLIPRYLYDDSALFTKFVEDKYASNIDDINGAYNTDLAKPGDVKPPGPSEQPTARTTLDAWTDFIQSLPPTVTRAGFGQHDNAPSLLLLRYRDYLRAKFHNDIRSLNAAWTEENVSFDTVVPPFERTTLREWVPDLSNPKVMDWYGFRKGLPDHFTVVSLADPLYRKFLKEDVYEDSLQKLNQAWGTAIRSWQEIVLPRTVAEIRSGHPQEVADWARFVRTKLPLRMVSLDRNRALTAWRAFQAKKGDTRPAPIDLPALSTVQGPASADLAEFVGSDACPATALVAETPDNLWRNVHPNDGLPIAAADWRYVLQHRSKLRSEFATRNFRAVLGYILLNGRSVWNTAFFCAVSILAAIIVNPMCAYALSRYPLPYAYKILLFLLATMAFPAEVAMIPNFLMLKELGMLNTFWALVLPGLASGFSIFLLKGFFDSLPRELYEAGILDGATEMTMFRRITAPLSLPIFSVIALNAFTGAYGAFLFAMVVCQNPQMWTLMVWLYNLQDSAPQYVIMAALTLAAVPTLIVFLLAQKVILRGIILPSFK